MTKTKIFAAVVALLVCVLTLGTTTSAFAASTEIRYADAPIISTYADETIYYTRKEVIEENYTAGDCPKYRNIAGLTNSCGAIAGAEMVAFYDKYYPELIPDLNPCYSNNKYRKQDSTYVPALMNDLYVKMRTNVDDVGVSESDFRNGLTSYFNGKGRQVSYQSAMSGSILNYTQCRNAVDNNKVIALFVAPSTVYGITIGSTYDALMPANITGAHIMVIYGYLKINYYNNSGLFRTDTYVCVSTGRDEFPEAYYRIDATTTQNAYIVNVQ